MNPEYKTLKGQASVSRKRNDNLTTLYQQELVILRYARWKRFASCCSFGHKKNYQWWSSLIVIFSVHGDCGICWLGWFFWTLLERWFPLRLFNLFAGKWFAVESNVRACYRSLDTSRQLLLKLEQMSMQVVCLQFHSVKTLEKYRHYTAWSYMQGRPS